MDTHSEIRGQLDRLTAHEPPLAATGRQIRELGRRRRRRTWGGAVLSLAAIAVAGGLTLSESGDGSRATDPADSAAGFSPDELASSLRASLGQAVPTSARGSSVTVGAFDAQENQIQGTDRDKATLWRASVAPSATSLVEVSLAHDSDNAIDSLAADCQESVGTLNLSCSTSERNGSTIETIVRAVHRQDGAWPVVFPKEVDTADGQLWFLRRVTGYRDGQTISASEYVAADSLKQAEASWPISVDELTSIATETDLVFPAPPADSDEPGCGWVVPEADDATTCGEQ